MDNLKPQKLLRIYWDGVKKNFDEFYFSYKLQTFDLQDVLDYTSYFIKLVIAVPYTNLMRLFNAIENNDIKNSLEPEIGNISTNVYNVLKI